MPGVKISKAVVGAARKSYFRITGSQGDKDGYRGDDRVRWVGRLGGYKTKLEKRKK